MPIPPVPPSVVETLNDFASSVQESCPEWFTYIGLLASYADETEEECRSLRSAIQALQEQHLRQAGVIEYQEKELRTARAEYEKALRLLTPAVTTPVSEEARSAKNILDNGKRATANSITTPSESSRLSEKLPDPDKFEGDRSDLRRFISQIHEKMTTNYDRFPTPQSRMSYVTNRLKGKPYAQVLPYIKKGVCDLPDYSDILDLLDRAFGDPNRVQNARRDLFALRQKNSDFGTFFAEFQRLALEGNVSEETLPTLLEQAINRELQGMLLHNQPLSRDYYPFAKFLQELENRRRQYEQIPTPAARSFATAVSSTRNPEKAAIHRVTAPVAHASSRPLAVTANVPEAMDIDRQYPSPQYQHRGPSRKETGACFRCGSPGHRVKDCPQPDTRPLPLRSGTHSPLTSPPSSPNRGRSSPLLRPSSPQSGVLIKGRSLD
jgi:hypothetical protein